MPAVAGPPTSASAPAADPATVSTIAADVLIDVRNGYETDIGHMVPPPGVRLLLPGTRTFAEMPAWFDAHAEELRGRTVLMYCTGGVRCERASAYLREKGAGFERVFQLAGGVQRYMEAAEAGVLCGETRASDPADAAASAAASRGAAPQCPPPAPTLWAGKLLVFDGRSAVTSSGAVPFAAAAAVAQQQQQPPPLADGQLSAGLPMDSRPVAGPAAAQSQLHVGASCAVCAGPWDAYDAEMRCAACGVRVLVCPACATPGAGAAAAAPASPQASIDSTPPPCKWKQPSTLLCKRCTEARERARTRTSSA
jgi:rhodanese-related sulfurtransferase